MVWESETPPFSVGPGNRKQRRSILASTAMSEVKKLLLLLVFLLCILFKVFSQTFILLMAP